MPKTTEQNRIVRTSKSEAAEVTNNKKNCARGIVDLLLTDTKHRAASLQQQSSCFYTLFTFATCTHHAFLLFSHRFCHKCDSSRI